MFNILWKLWVLMFTWSDMLSLQRTKEMFGKMRTVQQWLGGFSIGHFITYRPRHRTGETFPPWGECPGEICHNRTVRYVWADLTNTNMGWIPDKHQTMFYYNHVPCNSWDLSIWKRVFGVCLKVKFKWEYWLFYKINAIIVPSGHATTKDFEPISRS